MIKKINKESDFINLLKRYNLKSYDVSNIYINNNVVIITGVPEKGHNCDEMGCNSIEHVIYKGFLEFLKNV